MPMIDKTSRQPIYEQIVQSVEREIAAGLLKENEKLPSVRELSVLLNANPNTVQKAFAELDRAGLIVSYPGRGCFVAPGARRVIHERGQAKLSEIAAIACDLLRAGFSTDELHAAQDRACRTYQTTQEIQAAQERKETL
ncbi:MAG: GntR family transcriptional regulator [Clostridia bacterium]|nr:GntR family transcriptional regulator [Clostridia bacterium]